MLKTFEQNNCYIMFDDSLISDDIERCFDPQYWEQLNKVTGSATGRGTTWFVQLDAIQGALRHYRRGGLFGKIISDHYVFNGWEVARSIAEFNLLQKLNQLEVNVPRPIAARAIKHGFFYQADLLSEKIPDAQDLVDILQQRKLNEAEYHAIAIQIKKMHQAQVNHTDLNIHNILLDKQGKAWIIDFDKCYEQTGSEWKEGNLKRLLRSFNKEFNKRQIKWEMQDWECLSKAYHQ
ncbi:3-deoxy-D-manno-octulosonic acid kinase [Psychromonas sp. 14N.309.X.WAT.B.A12]|uniref:3-deoxy-D-manno-octulosonic acid kinase n=1 Tax=Psychromonas sp. 14N.309.X.WAT.B.A12 TaxID=2998322 RepID=UPI0025AEEF5F|nr:3-deoxy-D-manno-octulosonic acid kinase [Psychromonas sp. 14N.309.X.WAT.B.A12]MDN2664643.1 3-deoxy-D-manno-octulosonic acid kinase [Psychromonas sp. 14N.309.X.WAT.B.A12]